MFGCCVDDGEVVVWGFEGEAQTVATGTKLVEATLSSSVLEVVVAGTSTFSLVVGVMVVETTILELVLVDLGGSGHPSFLCFGP